MKAFVHFNHGNIALAHTVSVARKRDNFILTGNFEIAYISNIEVKHREETIYRFGMVWFAKSAGSRFTVQQNSRNPGSWCKRTPGTKATASDVTGNAWDDDN